MMRRLAVSALFFLALPACNGDVVVDGPSGGTSTTTGAGGAGGGSTGDVGSSGGIGGTGGGSGGSGGASCNETHDALSVVLSTWQGKSFACNQGDGDFEFSAQVVDTPGPGLFVLDSCSPAADCIPFISKLSISAPGIYTDVPKGAYVKVHIAISFFQGGCWQRIQIKNLPMWDGAPNPVMGGDDLWFLGVDGGSGAFADTPFMATPEALGCFPGEPMGCGEHEDYFWHFYHPGDPGTSVHMGETGYLGASLPGGYQFVSAHNLRSFSSGICDGPVDLAYWMKHEYPPD